MEEVFEIEFSDLQIIILKSLENGEKYGNEILSFVKEFNDDFKDIKTNYLYGVLKKLEVSEIITSYWGNSEIGGKRHYYHLTDVGEKILEQNKDSISDKHEKSNNAYAQNVELFDEDDVGKKDSFWHNDENDKQAKGDCSILPDSHYTQSKDAVVQSHSAEIRSTEIDYKDILGDLYITEKDEKKVSQNESSEIATKNSKSKISNSKNESVQLEKENTIDTRVVNENLKKRSNETKDYSGFGIKVKSHTKVSEYENPDHLYTLSSKLYLFDSLIIFAFAIIETIASFFIMQNLGILEYNTLSVFVIFGAICALLPIMACISFILKPNKKKKNTFELQTTSLFRFVLSAIFVVFVLSLNFLAGMTNLNQVHYIYYWLLPFIVALNFCVEPFIRKLLMSTNKFNA